MTKSQLVDELRMIAYVEHGCSKNRLSSLINLYKFGDDPAKILNTLDDMIEDALTPDAVRIKAIELYYKIDCEIGDAPMQNAIDIENVKETLLEQYCGNVD